MSAPLINEEAFIATMKAKLNAAMLAAAEPALQAALKEIERRMREELAKHIISTIETRFELYKHERSIHIVIDQR